MIIDPFIPIPMVPPVTSVNTKTGVVVINKTDVGLSAVNNIPDTGKVISTLQQAALDLKVGLSGNQSIAGTKSFTSAIVPKNIVSMDVSGNAVTLGISGTQDFPSSSGLYIVNDMASGVVSLFICGGGNAVRLGTTGIDAGAMSYNAGIGGYTWTNTSGVSRSIVFTSIKTRVSA